MTRNHPGQPPPRQELSSEVRQFIRCNIDIKEPMLVYSSLHYQNGGVEINDGCETNIPGLYAVGEASSGVDGRNRLMVNSVLDFNVFGRRAGKYAAEYGRHAALAILTLEHIAAYENELKKSEDQERPRGSRSSPRLQAGGSLTAAAHRPL